MDPVTCVEVDKFLGFCGNGVNTLEIGELGHKLAEDILLKWLRGIKRHLTNHQVDYLKSKELPFIIFSLLFQWRVVLNALDNCTLPLFVTLIFAEIQKWKSYSSPEDTT